MFSIGGEIWPERRCSVGNTKLAPGDFNEGDFDGYFVILVARMVRRGYPIYEMVIKITFSGKYDVLKGYEQYI